MGDGVWTRADQRHFALENVDELRHLVKTGSTQQATDLGHPGVIASSLSYRWTILPNRHCAEFINRKLAAIKSLAPLAKNERTRRVQHYRHTNHRSRQGKNYQPQEGEYHVDDAL